MFCASLDGSGVRGRMDARICVAESRHCSPETITLLISYTPQYKRFLMFKNKQIKNRKMSIQFQSQWGRILYLKLFQ